MNVFDSSFLIIGEGVTCKHCVEFFQKKNITFNSLSTSNISKINDNVIEHNNEIIDLNKIDYVIVSPGVPPSNFLLKEITNYNCKLTTDIEIVQSLIGSSTKYICVTGTNGKTSTVSLLSDVLNDNGINSISCGNNGISVFKALEKEYDFVIFELSSYQLEYIKYLESYISIILNLSQDHFERHKTYDEYFQTKLKIFKNSKFQIANDLLDHQDKFMTFNIKDGHFFINKIKVDHLEYKQNTITYCKDVYKITGYHEAMNLCACLAIFKILNLSIKKIIKSFSKRKLLQHRVEEFYVFKGIKFINDSKSTNADSTRSALKSISDNIILIMGGDKKEISYKTLIELINTKVKLLVIIGDNQDCLYEELSVDIKKMCFDSLDEATAYIFSIMVAGDTVLMSPGTSSYYSYDNYEHRGDHFKNIVKKYASN